MFCIGGPRRTPHVIVQANIDAHAQRTLEAPVKAGRYRIFGRGGAVASLEVGTESPDAVHAKLLADAVSPSEVHVSPGGALTIENTTEEPLHVKIERLGYASLADFHGQFRRDHAVGAAANAVGAEIFASHEFPCSAGRKSGSRGHPILSCRRL